MLLHPVQSFVKTKSLNNEILDTSDPNNLFNRDSAVNFRAF